MALEHLQYAPEWQGENTNYCWAAGLAWWLKAVRKYNYDFETIKDIYADWTNFEDDGGFGALNEKGMYKLLNDGRWHLEYQKMSSSEFSVSKIKELLVRSPVIIGYTDNNLGTDENGKKLTGFHMNVIVAGAGSGDSLSGFMVMDPNYQTFQIRNLQYYKNHYCGKAFLAYSAALSSEPVYGYEQSN